MLAIVECWIKNSRSFSCCIIEILYHWRVTPHFTPPLASGNQHSTFCNEFDWYRCLLWEKSGRICPYVTGLFHLAACPLGCKDRISFFLWLHNIPLYICKYTTFSLFFHLMTYILCCFQLLAIVNNIATHMGM